jgi:hypothetical protein
VKNGSVSPNNWQQQYTSFPVSPHKKVITTTTTTKAKIKNQSINKKNIYLLPLTVIERSFFQWFLTVLVFGRHTTPSIAVVQRVKITELRPIFSCWTTNAATKLRSEGAVNHVKLTHAKTENNERLRDYHIQCCVQ